MIKKLLLLSVILSQLAISCSSDETPEEQPTDPEKELTLEEQIANIVKQPYSNLTPEQQKLKLEVDANDMLTQLDKSKTSGAIEAIENLGRLFTLKHIDLFDGKSRNGVEDVLSVSGVYGIYTWNNAQKNWVKTASTTELKFVFPAKASQTANNAVLTSKSTSSDVKVANIDTYGDWQWNEKTGNYEQVTKDIQDWFYLPTSVDGLLTIDGTQAATFAQTAKYSNGKEIPNEFAYKVTLNDGYVWEMSGTKAAESTSKASFTFNNKSLIEFNAGSTAQIDALLDTGDVASYRGKANGLAKLMDNFIIVADMDLATAATDDAALQKNTPYPAYNSETYYSDISKYNKTISDGKIANFNKSIKLILVSKKDGTKIADIIKRSVKDDYGYYGADYYSEVNYLKFNDKTEVEMSVYFSKGFENLETKFEDFIKAFQK